MNIQYKQSDKDSRFLQPVGDGNIDVLDMAWTISPKLARKDVPYIRLVEYQQTTGQLIASIIYYGRVASRLVNNGVGSALQADKNPFDVYKYKYFAEPTGFVYKLPYFNPKKISRGNQFGYGDEGHNPFGALATLGEQSKVFPGMGRGSERLVEGMGSLSIYSKLFGGVLNTLLPGKLGFETPQSWTDTEVESYSVTFDLFNTGTLEDIENNRNLCHILSYQNSPSRRNFAIIDPPVIYSLTIPDVVHLPACYVSHLDIVNLGNTRIQISTPVGGGTGTPRTIPEAYRITMTFTSLLMPSRNILTALDKGAEVEAISDSEPIENYTKELFKFEMSKFDKNGNVVNQMDINARNPLNAAERALEQN